MSDTGSEEPRGGSATTRTAEQGVPAGTPVVLQPTPPGTWLTILGVCIAALAPLLGFLVGAAVGSPAGVPDQLFVPLVTGIMIGGVGGVLALLGGARLWRYYRDLAAADDGSEPAATQG